MIELFNLPYFIFLFLGIGLTVGLYFLLRYYGYWTVRRVLIILAFIGFALHFIKQFFYWDASQLHKSTLENICAISTVLLPFLLMKAKQHYLWDFMFLAGIVGGFGAMLYPTEALGLQWYSFETLRFYFCHWSLFAINLLAFLHHIYRPTIKNLWKMLAGFFTYELVICANTALLCYTGMVVKEGYTATELFLSAKYLNNSFTFGATQDMGFISTMFSALTPGFMKYDIHGVISCWPVVNLIGPAILIISPIYLLICGIRWLRDKFSR